MGLLSESWKYFVLSLLILYSATSCASACLEINEVSAQEPEWIEVYNPCGTTVNLSFWSLSDSQSTDEITCHISPDCTLQTDSIYFLILDRTTNITDITMENVTYFFVDDNRIGGWGLNNEGEDINLSNSSYSSTMTYSSSSPGKTWSFCNGTWTETQNVTPGKENSCSYTIPNNNSITENETEEDTDFGDFSLTVYEPSSSVRFGDFAHVRAYIYTGNICKPLRIVAYVYTPRWISNDLGGNTIKNHLNETDTALVLDAQRGHNITLIMPLFLKSNCDSDYSEGVYKGRIRVYEEGTDYVIGEETFNLTLNGNNPLFCEDCPECPECKKTTCSCSGSSGTSYGTNENEPELIQMLSFEENVQAGVPFETNVKVENTDSLKQAFSVYSYAYEGSRCLSLGFDGNEWAKGWTANSQTFELLSGEHVNVTLMNALDNETDAGIYNFRVRLKHNDKNVDITKNIKVETASDFPEKEDENFTVKIVSDDPEESAPFTGMASAVPENGENETDGLFGAIISWLLSLFKF